MAEEIKLTIPAQKKWISLVDEVVAYIGNNFEEMTAQQISFAVREAVINAVSIAEKTSVLENQVVEIVIIFKDNCLEIQVCDEGPGISKAILDCVASLRCEDILWNDSGRGLVYIKEYMDEFTSSKNAGEKHVFTMRKMIGGRTDEADRKR